MLFSFDYLLKLCKETEEVAGTFKFDFSASVKPHDKMVLTVNIMLPTFFQIVWCVQNESIPLKGWPILHQELRSRKSPLYPFNNESFQGTSLEWWGTPGVLYDTIQIAVLQVIDILKCAEKKVIGIDDMSHPDSILELVKPPGTWN